MGQWYWQHCIPVSQLRSLCHALSRDLTHPKHFITVTVESKRPSLNSLKQSIPSLSLESLVSQWLASVEVGFHTGSSCKPIRKMFNLLSWCLNLLSRKCSIYEDNIQCKIVFSNYQHCLPVAVASYQWRPLPTCSASQRPLRPCQGSGPGRRGWCLAPNQGCSTPEMSAWTNQFQLQTKVVFNQIDLFLNVTSQMTSRLPELFPKKWHRQEQVLYRPPPDYKALLWM